MEQHDKQHLQNIDKVEIHEHNHVDLAEVLSQLHIVKMQNNKILVLLENNDNDKVKALAAKLRQSTNSLKKAIAENTSLKT